MCEQSDRVSSSFILIFGLGLFQTHQGVTGQERVTVELAPFEWIGRWGKETVMQNKTI